MVYWPSGRDFGLPAWWPGPNYLDPIAFDWKMQDLDACGGGGGSQKDEWSTNWSTCREPGRGSTNQVATTTVCQPRTIDTLFEDM